MKPLPHIILLTLLACASTLIAQDEAENADPAAIYPDLPALADLIAAQTAEADSFPKIKDPGDPVQIANAVTLLVVADLPMAGDPITLAQASQSPAVPVPSAAGDPVTLAQSVQQQAVPVFNAAGNPVALADALRIPSIDALEQAAPPDLFTINRLFNWDKPHGQWMNQLLKDIDAAKKTGDTERYSGLTERYSAWAEKYLRRDDPPNLDGTPGR
jgi:hypothetical protein